MLGQEYVPFCNCCTFYSEGSNVITMAAAALGELTELFPINQLKLTGSKKCLVRPGIWRVNRLLTRLAVPMEINQRTIDFLTELG